MRDWLNASSLYIPAWVLLSALMGIWGPHSTTAIALWLLASLIVALFAWRASAAQNKQAREIQEGLGKLVSVTESSPTNVIAAVAAKILELEQKTATVPQLQSELSRYKERLDNYESATWSPPSRADREEAEGLLRQLGKHSVQFRHTGQPDCYEFAIELADIFKKAGWSVFLFDDTQTAHAARGITFQGRQTDPLPNLARDALIRITGMAMATKSENYSAVGDITVVIGPRKVRGSEWL